MDPPALTSPAEATEPRVSDNEVDDLLAQAEDLSAEIVEGVNTEGTDETSAAVTPVRQPQPDSNEAQEVSEAAQTEANDGRADEDLKDLLNDPDLASPDVESDSPRQDAPPSIPKQETLQAGAPAMAPVEEISLPPVPSVDDESPTEEVVPDDEAVDQNPGPEQDPPDPVKTPKKPITQRLATIPRAALSAVKTVSTTFVNSLLGVVVYLDRPFAKLPTHIKRTLGIAAIAIILTGVAVWILPGLLEQNPFAEMTPYTATDR